MKSKEFIKETGWRHERERLKVDRKRQLREIQEVHGDAYVAAYLYLNSARYGKTKPKLAKMLSEAISIGYDVAAQMIDAIDAYEDIKDAEEFKHVAEAIKRPELNVVHSRKELEAAYQQMISICDAQETTIEMLKERIEDLEDQLQEANYGLDLNS